MNYQSIIALNINSRTTLIWSIENLKFWNGWTFSQLNRKMITQTDACLEEWGAVCNGFETSGQWLEQQRTFEHKRAVCGTTRSRTDSIFLHQSKAALPCLLKMGGTRNKHMMKLSKEISNYLLNHEITITAKYLPSVLNTVADRESRKKPDSSEWLLHPKLFQAISRLLLSPTKDLFASCVCHRWSQCIPGI